MLQMFDHFSVMIPENPVKEELPDSPQKATMKPALAEAMDSHGAGEPQKRPVPTPCRAALPANEMSEDDDNDDDDKPATTTAKKPITRQDMCRE